MDTKRGRCPNAIGAVMDKEAREVVNINKKHFLMIGSSFGVPWFVLGSSLVFYREGIREVQRKGILRKVLFSKKYPNTIRE